MWGQVLARIAAAEVYNFRFETEPRVRAGEVTPAQALPTIQRALAELLPLADPLLIGIHRRWVDHELTQYAVREAEEHAPGAIPGAIDVCLLFCDLKDFTNFAELYGDAAATAAARRFAHLTVGARGEHGRVVKGLGDGAMLVYPEPLEAASAWRRFSVAMREPGLPALHVGHASGGLSLRRRGRLLRGCGQSRREAARARRQRSSCSQRARRSSAAGETGRVDCARVAASCARAAASEVEIFRLEDVAVA